MVQADVYTVYVGILVWQKRKYFVDNSIFGVPLSGTAA